MDERFDESYLNSLPPLTPAERAAMESCDMTPVLGTMDERLRVATNAAIRFMRERDAARNALAEAMEVRHFCDMEGCPDERTDPYAYDRYLQRWAEALGRKVVSNWPHPHFDSKTRPAAPGAQTGA